MYYFLWDCTAKPHCTISKTRSWPYGSWQNSAMPLLEEPHRTYRALWTFVFSVLEWCEKKEAQSFKVISMLTTCCKFVSHPPSTNLLPKCPYNHHQLSYSQASQNNLNWRANHLLCSTASADEIGLFWESLHYIDSPIEESDSDPFIQTSATLRLLCSDLP